MEYTNDSTKVSVAILTIIAIFMIAGNTYTETVTGCPLGLRESELWIKELFQFQTASSYFNSSSGEMEDLPDGWHQKVMKLTNRIGYGITDRFEVGVLFPYKYVNMRKQKQGNWVEKKNYGFEELWLSTGIKLIDREDSFLEAMKFGYGINLNTSSDELIDDGIGDGAMAMRFVFLSHEHLSDKFGLCNHFYYEWIGKAKEIDGWSKSEWEYGDKIGYKCFIEYRIIPQISLTTGPIGWMEIAETKKADDSTAHPKFYNHAITAKFTYLPTGDEMDHKKVFFGVNIPYKSRLSFSSDIVLNTGFMWTF
jgi:hypothetical protein